MTGTRCRRVAAVLTLAVAVGALAVGPYSSSAIPVRADRPAAVDIGDVLNVAAVTSGCPRQHSGPAPCEGSFAAKLLVWAYSPFCGPDITCDIVGDPQVYYDGYKVRGFVNLIEVRAIIVVEVWWYGDWFRYSWHLYTYY